MRELFRQHPTHSDYWFTPCGRVASIKTNNLTGKENFRELRPNRSGRYIRVAICSNYSRTTIGLHRLVYETFVGPIQDGHEINHIDGDKHNNSVSNLESVTHTGNMRHAVDTGLIVPENGLRHSRSILTQEQLHHIRRRLLTQREYARLYGCNVSTIQRAQYRQTYSED